MRWKIQNVAEFLLVLIVHGSRKDFISRIMMNSVTPVQHFSLCFVPNFLVMEKALILDVGSSVYDELSCK